MELEGHVAIVTGGSRGVGAGISMALAEAGAEVVINYRKNDTAAKEIAAKIEALGRRALLLKADVTSWEAAESMAKGAFESFGRIDILVNNAGIASRGNFVVDTDPQEWNRVIQTNLYSAFYCSKAVLKYMHHSSKGSIINISSIASATLQAGYSPYASAKAGLDALTKVLSREEGPMGIRVNAISPGIVKTEMGDKVIQAMGDERFRARLANTPLKRIAYPQDIGNLAVFLASEKASYITGKIILMDGGLV